MAHPNAYRFSVAPMMDWTDRHCRYFHRRLSKRAVLFSEMVTSAAVVHGDRERLIGFDGAEHPVVLQLGGSNPAQLAEAARIAEGFGYDGIDLNCGCPSDRVQSGRFGACLMAEPELVADCVAAMKAAVAIPVSVKCRIGIDEQAPEEALPRFLDTVLPAGADQITVHARKAWLKGLSPKENRSVPPLDYGLVYAMKAARPDVAMAINGGIATLDEALGHLEHMDGVMLGRAAYDSPALLAEVDARIFGADTAPVDLEAVIDDMKAYCARHIEAGGKLNQVVRHMLGLFNGRPGARGYRRVLTTQSVLPGAGIAVIDEAMAQMTRAEAERDARMALAS